MVKDFIGGKKIVHHHHHGHPHFRANPEVYREKYRRLGRKVLVSTPDLLHLVPEATWVPNLVDLTDILDNSTRKVEEPHQRKDVSG